jgi:hypothetical protein
MLDRLLGRLGAWTAASFYRLVLVMVAVGVVRNLLEMIGYFSGSPTYVGYYPTLASFLDTIAYVFLMVVAEGYVMNRLFGGTVRQLRQLLCQGVWLLLGLFVLIPVLNNLFNYHFFHFRSFYDLRTIHPTVGLHVAFALVLLAFPLWLRAQYRSSTRRAFAVVASVYVTHYLVTYQLMMNLSWGNLARYNPLLRIPGMDPVNPYTAGFTVMTLVAYPFFLRDYPRSRGERWQVAAFYFALWGLLASLLLVKLPWKPDSAELSGAAQRSLHRVRPLR